MWSVEKCEQKNESKDRVINGVRAQEAINLRLDTFWFISCEAQASESTEYEADCVEWRQDEIYDVKRPGVADGF